VIEILKWPKSTLSFLLAWEYDPGEGNYLDPPINMMEYDEVTITLTNTGDSSVTGMLYETALPIIFNNDNKGWSAIPGRIDIVPGQTVKAELSSRGRSFVRVFLRRTDVQKPTTVNVVVSYR
jgi:hypothetical protein